MSDQARAARARAEALAEELNRLVCSTRSPTGNWHQLQVDAILRYRYDCQQEALEEAMAQSCINSGCRVIDCSREGERRP